VDSSGNLYVAGFLSNNVFKITPGGSITEIIDGTGDGAGKALEGSFHVAVDLSNNVYVTGALSNNVFQITPGGTITEIIDTTGDGAGQALVYPRGVATDANSNVYVVGAFSDNAFQITPGGTITQIIDETAGIPQNYGFADGGHVAVAPSGDIYVTAIATNNVFRISGVEGAGGPDEAAVPSLNPLGMMFLCALLGIAACRKLHR
jgi:hypothetical protein